MELDSFSLEQEWVDPEVVPGGRLLIPGTNQGNGKQGNAKGAEGWQSAHRQGQM